MDSLTSTTSLPSAVEPQYSSFDDVSKLFRKIQRSDMFSHGATEHFNTEVHSPSVPTPHGPVFDEPKNLEGLSFVTDPMENFAPAGIPLEGRTNYGVQQNISGQILEANKIRTRGVSAYRKTN